MWVQDLPAYKKIVISMRMNLIFDVNHIAKKKYLSDIKNSKLINSEEMYNRIYFF